VKKRSSTSNHESCYTTHLITYVILLLDSQISLRISRHIHTYYTIYTVLESSDKRALP